MFILKKKPCIDVTQIQQSNIYFFAFGATFLGFLDFFTFFTFFFLSVGSIVRTCGHEAVPLTGLPKKRPDVIAELLSFLKTGVTI
jgi:hypothetical protein